MTTMSDLVEICDGDMLLVALFVAWRGDITSTPLPNFDALVDAIPAGSPLFDRALAVLLGHDRLTPTDDESVVSGD